ncbi:MAG: PrgI family mobile element protein [Candidatus Levyibacteriota bacterium]
MENHPIPQDVTGFKFRLIGSVTVKQFLYLLAAGGLDLLFYFFPIPLLLKIPLMIVPAIIGLALAFIPIDGRPMDRMIMNFIKALTVENQYIYRKLGAEMAFFAFIAPAHALQQINEKDTRIAEKTRLFNQFSKSYFKPDAQEQEKVAEIGKLFQEGQAPNQGFTNRVVNADVTPQQVPSLTPAAPVNPPADPNPVMQAPQTPNVQAASPSLTGGGSSSDVANILTGIVRDPRGKPVPHVIVEVMDINGTPLRTFRTSQDGGFAAATPLPNGNYVIHLEDSLKKQTFADVQVVLNGQVVPPVAVTSTDPREELRRELFGNTVQS